MSASPFPPGTSSRVDALAAGYEDLRREALQRDRGGTRSGRGLALFLTRGMVAWMRAFLPLTPLRVGPARGPGVAPQVVPGAVRDELTRILTSMVLDRKEC